jgi:hypothetical protein
MALEAPYLTLVSEDTSQRDYPLREVFNSLGARIVRVDAPWQLMSNDRHLGAPQDDMWLGQDTAWRLAGY